jgi:hypothetical protein
MRALLLALLSFGMASVALAAEAPRRWPGEGKNVVFPTMPWPADTSAMRSGPVCKDNEQAAILRVSRILPTGTRAGFDEAVREHQAWYRKSGVTDNFQTTMSIMIPTGEKGRLEPAKDIVVTLPVNPPGRIEPSADPAERVQRKAEWDSYVAKYKTNSEILEMATVCVPNGTGLK